MCGLVGVAGNIFGADLKMFRDMLLMDTVRGWDSTGVLAVPATENKPHKLETCVGTPDNLWKHDDSDIFNVKGMPGGGYKLLMGHNRWATTGEINKSNAHPFTYGNIVGAHNGSLVRWDDLECGEAEREVDSKAIFNTLNIKGIDHLWGKLNGAATLTWYDTDTGELNFIRNEQRPLKLATNEKGDTLYWASEDWMLYEAADRAGVKFKTLYNSDKEEIDPVWSLNPHSLVTFKPLLLSCKMTGVRDVKKKVFPRQNSGKNGKNTIGFKITKNNTSFKQKHINIGWAKGSEKTDKSPIGREFVFKRVSRIHNGQDTFEAAILESKTDSKICVQVYPDCSDDLNRWHSRYRSDSEYYFKIKHRPRTSGNFGGYTCLKIAERGVSLTKIVKKKVDLKTPPINQTLGGVPKNAFKAFGGRVTESRWWQLNNTMQPKNSCACCQNPLDINDHENIEWLSRTSALCPECSENDVVKNFVNS